MKYFIPIWLVSQMMKTKCTIFWYAVDLHQNVKNSDSKSQFFHLQHQYLSQHLRVINTVVMSNSKFFPWKWLQLVSMMAAPSGTIFVRRALAYLMIDQPELALRDAMQAQVCLPEWPTAFYMQALALSKLGMETDSQDMLNDGSSFEAKRQNSWRN